MCLLVVIVVVNHHLVTFETLHKQGSLTGLYSFVEDFRRNVKSIQERRTATFGAGWVMDADGEWHPLSKAVFTADGTPLDNINAGVIEDRFFLATGGETQQERALRSSLSLLGAAPAKPDDLPPIPVLP